MRGASDRQPCRHDARLGRFCQDGVQQGVRKEVERLLAAARSARSEDSLTEEEFVDFVAVVLRDAASRCAVLDDRPCRHAVRPPRGRGRNALHEEEWAELARRWGLSTKKLWVVKGVLDGWSRKKIAEKNDITVGTVHSHINGLYKRLGVSSHAELVVRVFREFLDAPR